jgi:modulator of FtsH protease HflK
MAWNDPQWGKKNSGPPDLDELWRRFNERLNRLFGGKRPPPSEGSGSGPSFTFPGGLGLIIGIVALLWVASGFYIVDAGERGVVLRFGKYVETTPPGPHWRLPYPIESVEVVNVEQVRTVEVGYRNNVASKVLPESLMLTDDENIIDIQFAVQYFIKNPEDYLFRNRSPDEAVMQVAESSIRETVGKSKMDFVLYEGREEVAVRAHELMQKILDRYQTGINISNVTMQNAQPPEQVQAAFDDAVKASQDRERLKNEGQAYANDVVPRARGVASRLAQESEGYKQAVIANAEGDASRFTQILSEYVKAPQVTRDRMYLDTMQKVMSSTSKVLVDQKEGGSLLYLPLDKLLTLTGQGGMTGQSLADQAAAPATPPSVTDDTWRSRDAFRGRDREARP